MKSRDRLVVCVLVAAAALAVMWLGLVSPKRQDAARLGSDLTAAQGRLSLAQSQVAMAKVAQAAYKTNLRVVKALYKAVPADDGVPRLLVKLDRTSNFKRVDFKVITVAGAAAAAGTPAPSAAVPGGLSPISFTFSFGGGYIALQRFLRAVADFTLMKGSRVVAHGRLLTIQSVALTPADAAAKGPAKGGGAPSGATQAAVTATAYSQPPATSSTTPIPATSTASAPAGVLPSGAATTATPTPTNTTR